MKLGELKSKIRTTKGSPMLQIELTPGALGAVALMKGPLMEALDTMYPGGKSVETGLVFEVMGDNAMIRPMASTQPYGISASEPGPLLSIMEAPIVKVVNVLDPTVALDLAMRSNVGEKMIINLLDDAPAKAGSNLLDLDDVPAPPVKKPTLLDF